ncbi:Rho GTPase activation protein [Teratosphaeria nubilosa]|uniref:Rho GTPase activation protein n=1 Tax=Teratosphaeria nubilosa TaxID=161662 RepID=A0A6G1L9I4_9PEZI|nr:Rho GTPase activation protein [Teratosphaeria nubilosa]
MSKATKGGGNFLTRLGKIGRSTSTNEKDIPDSEYVLKVINLPLVEQTRITRISKDLNSCRDKTEYWMPALPWRAIDYLNLNCESEGLYRVPGGHAQIKHWQRRFDTEFDIDLLDEKDLYDPNEIGSMLKKWLTDLPTEMMPAHLQSQLAIALEKENPDFKLVGQAAPQKLRDALSELPPFNYYLLFAVTCHLSLLLSNKDKNKMDLHNLSVCIGPCLKLERWLFNYLVGDWRHCWQGCFTEKQYLEAEKAHEQGLNYQPHSNSGPNSASNSMHNLVGGDERPVHSSGSSKPASRYEDSRSIHSQDYEPPRSRKESRKPETYRPAGSREYSGTHPRRSPHELPSENKRPSTSEGKDVESVTSGSSRPVAPRQYSHGRSKSDAVTTPVTTTYGSDYPFPMPARQ